MRRDTTERVTGHSDESESSQMTGQRRYTVHEAAVLLGLSVDAVRKRAERGSLKREKGPDGTVYIILDTDQSTPGHDESSDESSTSQLVDSLQDQVRYLRQELDVRNDELRRKDHLLAAALERIPELETPREPSEPPLSSSDSSANGVPPEQEPRSWWQRIFAP